MLFLSSPGGVGIAPTIELSSCHRDDIRPVAVLPPFSRFRTNESHALHLLLIAKYLRPDFVLHELLHASFVSLLPYTVLAKLHFPLA